MNFDGDHMYIISCNKDKATNSKLERIIKSIDPNGEYRSYTDVQSLITELSKPAEMAFIDADMKDMDGITLAKKITARYPLCNIVFLADGAEYMQAAFGIHASGYIIKPFTKEKIQDEILHRRYIIPDLSGRPLKVQCFGKFEAFINGKPVELKRQKSKMLLAYLIDSRGALCDIDALIGNIEPDCPADDSTKRKIRIYIGDLVVFFVKNRVKDLIIKSSGTFGINTSLIDCDYYRYLSSDPYAISKYNGEYMTGYDFAEETRELLRIKHYGHW